MFQYYHLSSSSSKTGARFYIYMYIYICIWDITKPCWKSRPSNLKPLLPGIKGSDMFPENTTWPWPLYQPGLLRKGRLYSWIITAEAQQWRHCTICGLRFPFLADRSGTSCGPLLLQLICLDYECAFCVDSERPSHHSCYHNLILSPNHDEPSCQKAASVCRDFIKVLGQTRTLGSLHCILFLS